jgi:hypothetical protein
VKHKHFLKKGGNIMRRHFLIIIAIFIAPAIAAGGIMQVDRLMDNFREESVDLELTLNKTELEALEDYFQSFPAEEDPSEVIESSNSSSPPESTWAEEILWGDMYNRIDEILDGYPAFIIALEHTGDLGETGDWYVIIDISGRLIEGHDTACYEAGLLFHEICKIKGMVLEVSGEYVPSTINPMDVRWTAELVASIGGPRPVTKEDRKEYTLDFNGGFLSLPVNREI